ncbi:hypothetical protein AU467_25985 [Mesorhizobium loti]|uniref:Uncharacterized protein n=1 Tax=Rhizobium loti TaxID=381 RepID=A0A101KR72_RHILI|nr:hypothetical protein AU467_25985 [Mesorhizobium loti]
MISFLAAAFFCVTTFGVVVVRTTFVLCFTVGVGSTVGVMVVHPATARAPDRIVATIACFDAQPTTLPPC